MRHRGKVRYFPHLSTKRLAGESANGGCLRTIFCHLKALIVWSQNNCGYIFARTIELTRRNGAKQTSRIQREGNPEDQVILYEDTENDIDKTPRGNPEHNILSLAGRGPRTFVSLFLKHMKEACLLQLNWRKHNEVDFVRCNQNIKLILSVGLT